jgi:hypothetical protein
MKDHDTPTLHEAYGQPPVYVDRLRVHPSTVEMARNAGERWGHLWCHLWSDDLEALHAMAERIGMRREWFQDRERLPHYDLSPVGRERAIAAGAVETSLKMWLRSRSEPRLKRPS